MKYLHYFFLALIVFVFSVSSCKFFQKDLVLREKGLTIESDILLWSINVGVLQDSQFKELDILTVRKIVLSCEQHLNQIIPGITFHFIVDQPLNAVYTMQNTYPKVFKNPKDLSIKTEIDSYESLTNQTINWERYFQNQVRYDIIFTNSRIAPSNQKSLNTTSLVLKDKEVISMGLVPASGRFAMEGLGLYLSTNDSTNKDTERNKDILSLRLMKKFFESVMLLTYGLSQSQTNTIFKDKIASYLFKNNVSTKPQENKTQAISEGLLPLDLQRYFQIRNTYLRTKTLLRSSLHSRPKERVKGLCFDLEREYSLFKKLYKNLSQASINALVSKFWLNNMDEHHEKFSSLCLKYR